MADCHEADSESFSVYGIQDPKAANAKLPQPLKFTEERLARCWISGNGTNRCLNGPFQVGMERADHLSDAWRNIKPKRSHPVRRFLAGASGSPKTSSKESPFFPER